MTKTNSNAQPTVQQALAPASKTSATTARTPRRRSAAKNVTPVASAPAAIGKVTKRDQLAALLVRDEGATLEQMIAATGWLPHTTRAALTGLRKAGYVIDSDKIDGVRTYRAVAPK